jgi:U3 small nucleolar RNA-associated protein 21
MSQVVVGCASGELVLLNFVTGSLLYTFTGFGSAVRSMVSSPALDVVGLALADGRAVLYNLK